MALKNISDDRLDNHNKSARRQSERCRNKVEPEDITGELVSAYEEVLDGIDGKNPGLLSFSVACLEPIDVKKIRKAASLTQSNLAEFMGVNISTVQHWEQGTRHPKASARMVLDALSRAASKKSGSQ